MRAPLTMFVATAALVAPLCAHAQSANPADQPPPPAPPSDELSFVPPLDPVFVGPVIAPKPRGLDWLLPFSGSNAVLGGVLLLSGGITIGAASNDEYCSVTGCIDRPIPAIDVNSGATLMGAGLGFAFMGGIGLLTWAVARPDDGEKRRWEGGSAVGFSALTLSSVALGVGIAQLLTYDSKEVDGTTAWPFFLATAALAGVGIPVFAVGSRIRPDVTLGAGSATVSWALP